jgi:hypothetical protein
MPFLGWELYFNVVLSNCSIFNQLKEYGTNLNEDSIDMIDYKCK